MFLSDWETRLWRRYGADCDFNLMNRKTQCRSRAKIQLVFAKSWVLKVFLNRDRSVFQDIWTVWCSTVWYRKLCSIYFGLEQLCCHKSQKYQVQNYWTKFGNLISLKLDQVEINKKSCLADVKVIY